MKEITSAKAAKLVAAVMARPINFLRRVEVRMA
jgi:hypothetical protein